MAQSSLIFAKESGGWGTVPSSGWREIPVASDSHKTRKNDRTYTGISSSAGSAASARFHRSVVDGADGVIEVPNLSNGLGVLFQTMCDSATSTVHAGGTLAFDQVFTWGPAGPPLGASISTEVRRLRKGTSTLDAFTYPGGRGMQLDLGIDVDQNQSLKFTMDYKPPTLQGSLPSRTIAEVDPDLMWGWEDTLVKIDGTAICATSVSLQLGTGNNPADKCIKRGDLRHEPTRKGRPTMTGSINWDYTDPVYWQAWIDGDVLPLEIGSVGPVAIEGSTFPSQTWAIEGIRFTGDEPVVSVNDPTKQSLPFEIIVDDDYSMTLTNVTSDATL